MGYSSATVHMFDFVTTFFRETICEILTIIRFMK
jgi:hypothetical protein